MFDGKGGFTVTELCKTIFRDIRADNLCCFPYPIGVCAKCFKYLEKLN